MRDKQNFRIRRMSLYPLTHYLHARGSITADFDSSFEGCFQNSFRSRLPWIQLLFNDRSRDSSITVENGLMYSSRFASSAPALIINLAYLGDEYIPLPLGGIRGGTSATECPAVHILRAGLSPRADSYY